jgi:hypothetical protein
LPTNKLVKAAVNIGTRPGREGGLRTLTQIFDQAANAYDGQAPSGPLLNTLYRQLKEAA